MGTGDGSVIGPTKILDHGADSARWTIVLVAEGYQTSEMAAFHTAAQAFVTTLLATAPFDSLQAAINVYRLDVTSTDSGADDPTACGGTGATARTYFDASFCNSGIRRLLECNTSLVTSTVTAALPTWNMIMVLVNSTVYGGSGGSIATFSQASGADEIGLHEMGHTAFGLADEYEYWSGCGSGETGHDHAPAVEPSQPDITANTNRATVKWADLILASTPVPTTSNADCSVCDPQANPYSADTVGLYEGAGYYHCGYYRPQYECRMRALGNPYCAVCRRRIVQTLTPFLPPKLVIKDFKDHKLEKVEKIEYKEFKEFKEFKERKPEKIEHEKIVVEVPKLKDAEVGGWQPGEVVVDPAISTGPQAAHFIPPELRPDLTRGALAGEPQQDGAVAASTEPIADASS